MGATDSDSNAFIHIDDESVLLSPDEDIGELKRRIEAAADRPQFVDFRAADGTKMNVLMSAERRVTIAVPAAGTPARAYAALEVQELPLGLMDI
ncbi:hypothetical protein [Microbacterium sp. USHLN186]|uniref:hypothetical protein n=1 Tax=Microbacterium sp. USHLN186 TaxID=3081286 RepID=UPI00301A9082